MNRPALCCLSAVSVLCLPLAGRAAGEATNTAVSAAEPMVVTATRLSLDPIEQPYAFYRHDRQELGSSVGSSALDRMDYGPGVIIQHTAPGQTSPYIRGLTGRQSLLLFDGVRLSHATMRGGPNEYSALIPDMSIDSIDAILGSSSVVNGSDGLTGALDLRLDSPGRGVGKPVSPWVSTRIDSANGVQMGTGVDGKSGDWRYSIEGSFLDFHDRVGGKDAADNIFGKSKADRDRIPNTAYDQSSFAARAAYDGFMDRSIGIALGRTRQDDARRPDGYFENSGDANRISRTYDPETFTYLHLRDKWTPDGLFFDKLTTTAWWHQFDENQQREDLTGGKYRRREFDDRIDSIGVEPQATSQIGSHELTYGVFTLFERTSNDYREYRNSTGTEAAGATAFKQADWSEKTTITDGAQYNTYAIYAQDLWQFAEQWSLLSGLRYTYVDWDFDVASGNADDLTGSLRTRWQFREDMLTFVGVSKAFRAPNLGDLDGATDRASSGNINFGNPELDPELGYTVEAGWRYAQGRDQLGASVFHTIIEDVIQTVYPSGGGDGMSDNGESAYLQGVELLWDYGLPLAIGLGNRLALVGSISLVDSEEEVPQPDGGILDRPISRANRLYGLAGLRYEITRNWWTKVQVRFSDAYGRNDVTADDATDVRLTVPGSADGTIPGFGVVDLAGGWISNGGGRWMSLVLENLADKTYRQLGSGADAPGFNIGLNAGVRF